MHNLENKKCKVCNEVIPMPRPRDKIKEFCGRKCVSIFYNNLKRKPLGMGSLTKCCQCNKEFVIRTGKFFCSRECFAASQIIIHYRNCERCGIEFILDNIAYERRGAGRFCSMECGTRKFEFDENYFSNIDTGEKAYWLGFLFADGCVTKNEMKINLAYKDRDHLEKFRLALNAEHTVKIYNDIKCTNGMKASFFIGSKKLTSDLIKLGCIRKKTHNLVYPNIPTEFNSHFIRGYFDGDGCIYVGKYCKNVTIYCATNSFIEKISSLLQTEADIILRLYKRKNDRVGLTLTFTRKLSIINFYQYIYRDSSIHLERKYEKFTI